MVKRNMWLDVTPQGAKATANRGIQVDQWLTGTVTEQVDSSNVAVELDGSDSTPVVAPAAAGITYIGARVRVLRDSTGRIVQVEAPLDLPEGVDTIPVGATGWAIMDAQSGVNETREALTAAKAELESSQAELASNLSVTDAKLDAAQEYIDNTVTPGLQAAQSAADAAADAAAQAVADGVVSVVTEWAVGSSETTAPTSGWSTSTPARTAGTFIWSRTTTTKGDGTASTSSPVLVTGNTGAAGADGADGKDGAPGKDGVGLSGTVISYAKSTSGTSAPSSGWQATVPSSTPGQYLWTRTVWSYTDGTSETGYSVSMWGATGAKGDTGADGIAGKDGVGISSTSITYAASSSGTTAPTSGWVSTPPSASAGQYVWTRTVWTYTDGTTETGYSVGKIGNTGAAGAAGVSVSSVTPYYCLVGTGATAPAKPTTNPPSSSWTLTEPAYQSNTELYRCDLTVMSDGSWSWGAVSKVSSYTAATWAASQTGDNVIADPSMSGGQWAGLSGRWSLDTTMGRTDSASLKSAAASGVAWIAVTRTATGSVEVVPVEPGQVWEVSGWCQTTSDWNGTAGNSKIRISNQDDSLFAAAYASASVDKWTQVKTRFTIPATGMTGMRVTLGANNTAGTIWWDDLSVRDVTEAQQALTVANLATAMAQGLVTASTTAPDVTQVGRVWLVLNGSGNVVGMKISNGSAWTSYTLMADQVLVPSSVGTVSLANGAVTAPKITATSDLWTKVLAVAGDATIGGNLLANGAVTAKKMTVTQELWGKLATFVQITTDMLVAGGAKITGTLLADIIQLASRLVAGDPDGTRAELDPYGLHVYRRLLDGSTAEVARFGTDSSDDYIGILDAEGNSLAGIGDEGRGSFQSVDAGDSLIYRGDEMSDLLYAAPQGVVAAAGASAFPDSIANLRTSYGLCEIAFTAPVDGSRMYKVSANFLLRQWGSATNVSVVYTTDGSRPMVDSTVMSRQTTPATAGGTDYTVHFETLWPMRLTAGQTVRLLLMIAEDGADSNIAFVNSMNPRFWVEDLGPAADFGGVANSGGGTLPGSSSPTPPATTVPKRTYTKTVSGSWGRSFKIDGTTASGSLQSKAVQGYGGGSFRMSMIGFPSIISDLSGATVKKVEVYLYFEHWWNNSGGTASIGYHGSTSAPSTWGGTYANVTRSGILKPGGVWVTLPSSTHSSWKSGAYRGVTLRAPSDSTDRVYYGYANPSACKLRYTYVK